MALIDKKISEAYSGRDISSLSNRPNEDGIDGEELKARFDQLGKEVIPKHNALIDELVIELANARSVYVGDTEPTEPKEVWIDTDEAYDVDVEFIQGIPAVEQARVDAEVIRNSNEVTRQSNESTRQTTEGTRVSNENVRIASENARNVFESYNNSTPYVIGNKVSYNGSSYVCKLNSTGNLPTNTTYWLLIAQKGDTGEVTTAAMNAALANKADKLYATNLVTNGDFSNGITGFIGGGAILSSYSNTLSVMGNGSSAYPQAYQSINISSFLNHKIYFSAVLKTTNTDCTQLSIQPQLRNGTTFVSNMASYSINNPINGTPYRLSSIYTMPNSGADNVWPLLIHSYANSSIANTKIMEVKHFIAINLTSIFGAGKEPTKEQMDWLLAQKFTNSWFNGTAELTSILDLLTLVNAKANITQEAWITPTLLNGATIGTVTPQYYKDQFGVVRFKGNVKIVNNTLSFMTMPTGYRPEINSVFCCWQFTANNLSRVIGNAGGVLTSPNTNNGNIIALDSISYRAES